MKYLRQNIVVFYFLLFGMACPHSEQNESQRAFTDEQLQLERERMVHEQIFQRGVRDSLVLEALRKVPRHLFVPPSSIAEAYDDHPLHIGKGQTISQPYIVAFMTEQLDLQGNERVLEVGTGSGYQAAVLAEIAHEVYTIEIIEELAYQAQARLQKMNYQNIFVRHGDGYRGWPEKAPFDAIMVTAAPKHIPKPLLEQLKPGGRMILPVGDYYQDLILITKSKDGKQIKQQRVLPVRFVPMTGEAEKHK